MDVPEVIVCVECGGEAHRQSYAPEDGFEAGDVVAYACVDCSHRLDLVFEDAENPLE